MSNSMVHFVDTDLHNMSVDELLMMSEKRIGSSIRVVTGRNDSEDSYDFEENYSVADGWYLWRQRNLSERIGCGAVMLGRGGSDASFSLHYNNCSFTLGEVRVNGKGLGLCDYNFNLFCRFLSEDTSRVLHQLKEYIDVVNMYIKPVINCHRLFLCGDQVYSDEKEWWNLRLEEDHLSFDEIIEMNRRAENPEAVYTWDNLDILMKAYIGWGMFFFDLDNLPEYLV